MAAHCVTLNTGHKMPIVGLGTWQSKDNSAQKAVECAIENGYRHIDDAWDYHNEEEVGNGLANMIKKGIVKREDIFLTSKLWSTFHDPKDVRGTFMESLKMLQADYLDLYLMHFPVGFKSAEDAKAGSPFVDVDYVDTWKAMEELQKEGLVRSIGVSNFNKYQINRIINEATIVPAVNQIENHPYLAQKELVEFCKSKGVAVTAYSPLGCKSCPSPPKKILLEEPKVVEIAERLKKTVAQVLIRFQIQRDVIAIPKSVTPSRIKSNFQVFDFELSEADMKILNGLDENLRVLEWIIPGYDTSTHKYYPFRENYSE